MLFVKMLVVLSGYSMACLGVGLVVLSVLRSRVPTAQRPSAGTELATAFILGQGILASFWVLIGLAGWFYQILIVFVVVVCVVVSVLLVRHWVPDLASQIREIYQDFRAESWGWQLIIFLVLLLCLSWITSLGRSMMGDATAYYMALPKLIAYSNHLLLLPGYTGFGGVGLQGEMHYAALIAMGSEDAARLFAWPTILAGAVMLLALGRQIGMGRRGQWILLAMVFTSSAVISLSGDGKVDLFAVAFGFAAYYWVLQIRNVPRQTALLLTGLLAGFALIAKLSYVPVLIPGLVVLLIWGFREDLQNRDHWGPVLRQILWGGVIMLAGIAIAFLPHLIKNGILLHNPISPFGVNSVGWADQTWFSPGTTRRIILTYPFALTFGGYWAQYGDLSPLVLAFLPLVIFLPRPRSLLSSPLIAIAFAALIGVVAWNIYRPSVFAPRYILATLLLFTLPAARAAEHVTKADAQLRWLTAGIMGSVLVTITAIWLYFLGIVFLPKQTYQYATGKLSECDRDGMYCRAMAAINEDAAIGDRVFLASYQSYWLRGDLLQCMSNSSDTAAIFRVSVEYRPEILFQQGFRFLLFDQYTDTETMKNLNLENPPTWMHLTIIFQEDKLTVYRIDADNPPIFRTVVCHPGSASLAGE